MGKVSFVTCCCVVFAGHIRPSDRNESRESFEGARSSHEADQYFGVSGQQPPDLRELGKKMMKKKQLPGAVQEDGMDGNVTKQQANKKSRNSSLLLANPQYSILQPRTHRQLQDAPDDDGSAKSNLMSMGTTQFRSSGGVVVGGRGTNSKPTTQLSQKDVAAARQMAIEGYKELKLKRKANHDQSVNMML